MVALKLTEHQDVTCAALSDATPSWAAHLRIFPLTSLRKTTTSPPTDDALERELDEASTPSNPQRTGRDALRRQLALLRFERLRKKCLASGGGARVLDG